MDATPTVNRAPSSLSPSPMRLTKHSLELVSGGRAASALSDTDPSSPRSGSDNFTIDDKENCHLLPGHTCYEGSSSTELSSDSDSVRQRPFNRVVNANARALKRGDELKEKFHNIFKFKKVEEKGKYTGDYVVTLKPEHEYLPLKKVLEILQQHRRSEFFGSKELNIKINIGGEKRGFRMVPSKGGTGQVMIQTLKQGYSDSCFIDGYDDVVKILDKGDKVKTAREILEALNSPMDNQDNIFTECEKAEKQAIVSLIATTQVAEAVSSNGLGEDFGRTPGMNKLSRASLESINQESSTFSDEFKKEGGRFFPTQKGGTKIARQSIKDRCSPIAGIDRSFYMSDSSSADA